MRKLIKLGRTAGNVRHAVRAYRQHQAEREARELAALARERQAAQGGSPTVPARRLYTAGLIDQWFIWGSALCFLVLAVQQFAARDEHTASSTVLTLAPLFVAVAIWPVVLVSTQRHFDSTVGMFVLGLRYGPRRKADVKDYALNHIAFFWEHFWTWFRDRSHTFNDAGEPGAVLVDQRIRAPAGWILRALVAAGLLALAVLPVLLILT